MREPYFQLIYQGRDITSQFSMWPTEITYTDHHHGKADEVTVKVHNSTGQWLDVWEPQSGDKFSLRYGYKDEHAPAGTFSVDESSASGDANGDTFDFKGLSAAKTKELRTEKHKAYEKQSLSDVVNKIASEHGLQMEGEIEDIDFERITQNGESDLAFLKRLADDYGHYFKVSSDKSVFTSRDALRSSEPARVYDRLETGDNRAIKSYTLRDADHVAANKATVSYLHPKRKKVVRGESSSSEDLGLMTASGDIVKLDVRVENEAQAQRVAKSHLDKRNSPKYSGSLELVGDPGVVAGIVIELANFGNRSGKYLVTSSKHTMRRGGYTTTVEIEGLTKKQAEDGKKASEKTKKSGETAKAKGKSGGSSDSTSLGVMGADGVIRPGK